MHTSTKILATLCISITCLVSYTADTNAMQVQATHIELDHTNELNLDLPFQEIGQMIRADLGHDGVDEIIVSAGFNESPIVAVLRLDGSRIGEFIAFDENYKRGVTVTVGDFNGNGTKSIAASTMQGGGPHVRIFNAYGKLENQFFAYNHEFNGGVNLTTADIDGDNIDEIVTAAGLGGGPHVKIFKPDGNILTEFFAFDADDNAGIAITNLDTNEDSHDELVVAHYGFSKPEARIINFTDSNTAILSNPFQLNEDNKYGVSLFHVNNTTFGVASNGNGNSFVKTLNYNGELVHEYAVATFANKNRIHATTSNDNGVLITSARPVLFKRLDKHILVNTKEQRLYALENGIIQKTYLISSGIWQLPTPTGEFKVMRKLRWHDYKGFYGENDPRNYNLPNVEYNLEFKRHFYIHNAYWHNNWGHPMSHGCVNAPYKEIAWTYNWTDVGTPVVIL